MKTLIFIMAILLNPGYKNAEKKITGILVKKVDFEIETPIQIDCDGFENYFGDVVKTHYIRNESVLKKMGSLIKKLHFLDEVRKVDTRQKVIIFYSDHSKDILCIGRFGITLNGRSIRISKEEMNFILKLE